jgi:hypothetical protein
MPQLFKFDMVFADKETGDTVPGKHWGLLPHELFHTIYTTAPELFQYLFVGSEENLEYFWRKTMETDPEFCNNHPCMSTPAKHRRFLCVAC